MATESEFGGVPGLVQPPPHIPTPSEQLSLIYRTGDPSGLTPPDDGSIWAGLRQEQAQRAAREAEGAFVVGEEADALLNEALQVISELSSEAAGE